MGEAYALMLSVFLLLTLHTRKWVGIWARIVTSKTIRYVLGDRPMLPTVVGVEYPS